MGSDNLHRDRRHRQRILLALPGRILSPLALLNEDGTLVPESFSLSLSLSIYLYLYLTCRCNRRRRRRMLGTAFGRVPRRRWSPSRFRHPRSATSSSLGRLPLGHLATHAHRYRGNGRTQPHAVARVTPHSRREPNPDSSRAPRRLPIARYPATTRAARVSELRLSSHSIAIATVCETRSPHVEARRAACCRNPAREREMHEDARFDDACRSRSTKFLKAGDRPNARSNGKNSGGGRRARENQKFTRAASSA